MKKYLYILLLLIFNIHSLFSQEDTEFWFVAPDASVTHGDRPIYLVLTTQAFETNVEISMPANPAFSDIKLTIPPNKTKLIDLTSRIFEIENKIHNIINELDPFNNKGIYINATAPIKAYYEVSSNNNPEIFALKGKNALGKNFYTIFQEEMENSSKYYDEAYSGFHIVATENGTKVTISPTHDLCGKNKAYPKDTPFTITLNKGETFIGVPCYEINGEQMISGYGASHPSGTKIVSDKPVAVTLHDCSVRGLTGGCLDLRGDQTVPVDILGHEYIVMKGEGREENGINEERVYIMAVKDDEKIYINGTHVTTLDEGEKYIYEMDQAYAHIRSEDSVIYVMQVSGQKCEMGAAILPTTSSCTGSFEVAFTRTGMGDFYLNIMVRKGAEDNFLFNGKKVGWLKGSLFKPVPGDNRWLALKTPNLYYSTIPLNKNSLITNTKDLFHLGLINTNKAGTKFGYFSNFNEFTTDVINTNNGLDSVHACYGKPITFLSTSGMSEFKSDGLKYQWNTGDTTPFIEVIPKVNKTFSVTVTINNDCNLSATDSGLMTVSPKINGNAYPEDTIICAHEPVKMTAEGSDFYYWSNGMEGDTITANPVSTGYYYVSVTDSIGCYDLDSIFVTTNPLPSIGLNDNVHKCTGDTAFLDSKTNPSFNITWDNGDKSAIRSPVISDGTFWVNVISNKGCFNSDTSTVIFHSYPVINKSNDTAVCKYEPVKLYAYGGTSYEWSNGATSSQIVVNPEATGYYYVTVENYNCKSYDSVAITDVYELPKPGLPEQIEHCINDTLTLTATGGTSYIWSNGETNDTIRIMPFNSTNYQVTVTNTYQCTNTDDVQIIVNEKPYIKIYKNDTLGICPYDSAFFSPDYTESLRFKWNTGDSTSTLKTNPEGQYIVTVTNNKGCHNSDSIQLIHYPIPYAFAGNDKEICIGESTTLKGSGGDKYKWSTGETTPGILIRPDSTKEYKLTVSNSYECEDKDTVKVVVHPLPLSPPIIGADTVYTGDTGIAYSLVPAPSISYSWSLLEGKGVILGTQGKDEITVDWGYSPSDKEQLIVVSINDTTGCTSLIPGKKDITIVYPPSVIIKTIEPIQCFNDSNAELSAMVYEGGIKPFRYKWNTGATSNYISNLSQGHYSVTIYDQNNKLSIDSVYLSQPAQLKFNDIKIMDNICYDDNKGEITIECIGGTPDYDYKWSGLPGNNNTMLNLYSGNYYVTVTDQHECMIDTSLTITSPEEITYRVYTENPFCPRTNDGKIKLNVEGGTPYLSNNQTYMYQWSNSATTDSINNLEAGKYKFTITDANYCEVQGITVLRPEREICIDIPNAFSPNGDGVNEKWYMPDLNDFYPDVLVEVYDRWGNLIFVSNGYHTPWDGTYKGQELPLDSYHFIIDLKDDGRYINGAVTIIR